MAMAEKERSYIAIDLKSFYASVECVEHRFVPIPAVAVIPVAENTSRIIFAASSLAVMR